MRSPRQLVDCRWRSDPGHADVKKPGSWIGTANETEKG